MIFSYGDLTPTSPPTRVFFILYGLVAVPVIASFAVQTVAAVLSSVALRRKEINRAAREAKMLAAKANHHRAEHDTERTHHPRPLSKHPHRRRHRLKRAQALDPPVGDDESADQVSSSEEDSDDDREREFEAHARFVIDHWDTLEDGTEDQIRQIDAKREQEQDDALVVGSEDSAEHMRVKRTLVDETFELVNDLESQARALLIMALPRSVPPRRTRAECLD